jgi:hypothetical protein
MPVIHKDEKGNFPAYAWPGGYPIIYVTDDADILCADCAAKEGDKFLADIHYEGPPEYCADCGKEIESAYGDPAESD